MPGIQRQLEIYQKGILGRRPEFPVQIEALERAARATLSREAYDYVAGGAGSERTMRANREAFDRWHIVPNMMMNIADRDLSVSLFGQKLKVPFLLAPIGVQSIVHKSAEVAVARAAGALGVPVVLSTASSKSMEEVASAAGNSPHWFQLYWPKVPELARSFIARAEAADYSALVVTLDTTLLSWRERDIQNAYLPFLTGEGLANYFTDPVFRSALAVPPEKNPLAAVRHFAQVFSNPALTWNDLKWLRKQTRLPIVLKGILHPDDARKALRYGVDGIIVSNHGGRQVDGAIASLDALPAIVQAVGKKTTVLFDSGIRRGADVFKAIALGAQAVLVGRPYMWGLAVGGERGVRHVLENLIADIDLTLGLAGYTSFAQVDIDSIQAAFIQ
ncbi:MAG TPA: lactate 2-monooxygenase [Bacteroidota bacterium]|nr:lactate 2-monooxygenase [Bacteroidota bacterium]